MPNSHFTKGRACYGLQQDPAVGSAIAERIVEGAYQTVDLSRFGSARVLRNVPLKEANVA